MFDISSDLIALHRHRRRHSGAAAITRDAPAGKVLARLEPEDSPYDQPVEVRWVREMDAEEVEALLREGGRRTSQVVRAIRMQHHAIARMLAAGATKVEAAEAAGVATGTVDRLMQSPAFQALLTEYSMLMDEAAADMRSRLQLLAGLGVEELTNRVAAGEMPTKELKEVTFSALDRIGYGPSSTVQSTTVALTAADIRALKEARKVVDVSGRAEVPGTGHAGGGPEMAEGVGGASAGVVDPGLGRAGAERGDRGEADLAGSGGEAGAAVSPGVREGVLPTVPGGYSHQVGGVAAGVGGGAE